MKQVQRLDLFLSNKFSLSRTVAKQRIIDGFVSVNNKIITKPNYQINLDDMIVLKNSNDSNQTHNDKEIIKPWKKNLEIIYEDQYIFVINKPNNILVHPTNYENNQTLANIVSYLFNLKNIEPFGDFFRMGIVHRLDKCTEGLIIVAKNLKSFETFTNMFLEKKIEKKYLALLHGYLKTKIVEVDAPIKRIENSNKREVSNEIDAKNAITIFKEIKKYKDFSLVEVELLTGRTHQIRVHAEFIKNHVINDPIYGPKQNHQITKYGQYLFANHLKFIHPFTKKEIMIELDMPKEFQDYINKYGKC